MTFLRMSSFGSPTSSPRANSELSAATTTFRNEAQSWGGVPHGIIIIIVIKEMFLAPISGIVFNGIPIDPVARAKILGFRT
ncbi:hypothetical protein pdam_00024138 [Pocillopora damicornis]|uniref:Uncharacterized protein n=1 Tax=Pocillopora damicornis TaxID=46731 RepID=A0A3M6V345_POCDA|nr:hypothetical protein pdam_00024138 [Pocillopora damicornis]